MGAASADRDTAMRFGEKYSYPVAATTKIYAGTLVCIDASGNAVPAANTAGLHLVGVATAQADNSTGNAGDVRVEVWRNRHIQITTSGASASDVGMPVFVAYDNEVSLFNGNVFAGVISEYVSATSVIIDMTPAIEGTRTERVISVHTLLSKIAAADLVSAIDLGIQGVITKIAAVTTDPATTASKLATVTPYIGTTALTGGVLSLTTAGCNTLGKVASASTITGANRFKRGDTIKFIGSDVTAFVEGAIDILITVV